ncbi:aspartate aminotransferase family protein [Haliovirga abyssi]|uniref:Acetylornithine aminotransferase n=1 Tax=Haliovirga abyssi TaxID=2996794 RepID=A0AAU9DHW5_9FUSO|nr:aspartate aminotransferase family protein [Haliovirga abyssi]BDU51157.1 acetylornithine aminotransferase [Haliovirga abyssi]
MDLKTLKEKDKQYIMNTYGKIDVSFVSGDGVKLYDTEGNEYLDFFAGIAVNNLGYSYPKVVEAIKNQAEKIMHSSNLYYIEPQIKLAELLVKNTIFDKVFFANSGAEANEGAIKLARKYGKLKLNGKFDIITMKKSFHGRTLTTVTATGQEKYQKHFTPLTEGFKYAEFGNIEDLKSKIDDNTLAIMIEVIQGEGGVNIAPKEYWEELQKLVDEKGILLIIDEVQTGVGRTGYLYAYEIYGLKPHMITSAKALGNGLPIGALLATDEVSIFEPGDHASTFGGNFMATASGIAVVEEISKKEFLYGVRKKGEYFRFKLNELVKKYNFVKSVRGKGLMIGLEIESDLIKDTVEKMLKRKILIGSAGGVVLRFLPPLIIEEKDIDAVVENLDEIFEEIKKDRK